MRKLLLGTTALAAAATLTANTALADVTISGSYEFKYLSRSSNNSTLDGTSMVHGDTDMVINFTTKTDSGLDLTYRVDFDAFGNTETGSANIDETSLAIAGGFGKIVLGRDDDAADAYNIDEMDLPGEEPTATMASSSIGTSSSISSDDAMKVAYHLPAMGGLTAGISHTDRGAAGGTDSTSYGAKYSMDAAGASITLGYAAVQDENSTQDIDQENMGMKIVSGDISLIISQGGYEASDEDRENQGASISYAMPNGMVLSAYTFKSEDDLDVGEEFTRSGAEIKYNIASGLDAFISVDDYDYKITTANHESTNTSADSGTMTQLTIQASF
jgi:outer membrane protein OmpU